MSALLEILRDAAASSHDNRERAERVRSEVLRRSACLHQPNFDQIEPGDLEVLFDLYDAAFFAGKIRETLDGTPLRFGLSTRMTRAGGKTTRCRDAKGRVRWFEICVSTTLLFDAFDGDDHRPIVSSGILCPDRLSALQRIMEHEIVHLVEMLLWQESSCGKARFHTISRQVFGHTENRHQIITPRERAAVQHGIRAGVAVRFRHRDVPYDGVVNRVTKRATVLVEDAGGELFNDGRRYRTFYVPVDQLERLEGAPRLREGRGAPPSE